MEGAQGLREGGHLPLANLLPERRVLPDPHVAFPKCSTPALFLHGKLLESPIRLRNRHRANGHTTCRCQRQVCTLMPPTSDFVCSLEVSGRFCNRNPLCLINSPSPQGGISSFPFYRRGNRGSERVSSFSKVTLEEVGLEPRPSDPGAPALPSLSPRLASDPEGTKLRVAGCLQNSPAGP